MSMAASDDYFFSPLGGKLSGLAHSHISVQGPKEALCVQSWAHPIPLYHTQTEPSWLDHRECTGNQLPLHLCPRPGLTFKVSGGMLI